MNQTSAAAAGALRPVRWRAYHAADVRQLNINCGPAGDGAASLIPSALAWNLRPPIHAAAAARPACAASQSSSLTLALWRGRQKGGDVIGALAALTMTSACDTGSPASPVFGGESPSEGVEVKPVRRSTTPQAEPSPSSRAGWGPCARIPGGDYFQSIFSQML